MSIQRIALTFDNRPRLETTGAYCHRALEPLADVKHTLPDDVLGLSPGDFDLFLNIDDGLRYRWPAELKPSAWWAIDTHMDFQWCLTKARDFDFVFAAQQDGAAQLVDAGITSATWLPLGCDPVIHRKHEVPKEHDICFVGHVFPGPRANLIELIRQQRLDFLVDQLYFKEMAKAYSASRVVFNRSVKNDINMRVFEALACGSLLLTNDLADNGQEELFRDGVHLATYRGEDELIDKLGYYLKHDEVRERVASAGRAEAISRHTYRHRMERLLEHIDSPPRRTTVRMPSNGKAKRSAADSSYFEFARPELLERIPQTAHRILEVGCGAGRLGESLKARQPAEVVGIELNSDAAKHADDRLDEVIVGDIETLATESDQSAFDCVICGDVLEHLLEPDAFLQRARGWLTSDGSLVASIPNVRHHSVITSLLAGNWTYELAGLLDATHSHFFTQRDIEALFHQAGYVVEDVGIVPGPGYDQWAANGRLGSVQVGTLCLQGLSEEEAEEFFVYQYLVTAKRRDNLVPPTNIGHEATQQEQPAGSIEEPEQADAGVESTQPNASSMAPSGGDCTIHSADSSLQKLSILYVADFRSPGKSEQYAAAALVGLGHEVRRVHDTDVTSPDSLLGVLDEGKHDCLLFYKGCLGAQTLDDRLHPTGQAIAEVLHRSPIPGYAWYFDRVYDYDSDLSREAWMRNVAPLCRVAFVTDGASARNTDWAHWHVVRQGACRANVEPFEVADEEPGDIGFLGQLYGNREAEIAHIAERFQVDVISNTFGPDLNGVLRSYKIILGPQYPSIPYYWSNRIYVVLGHGGFFLAPEVEGMREEGFVPGVHYAALGDDPLADIDYWLKRPDERHGIAQAGQELVLSRFTYEHRVAELTRVIVETL